MVSETRNDNTGIFYPSLRTILSEKNETLGQHAQAMERLMREAFGTHHILLTPDQRRWRLDLWKLINLTRQIDLLDDLDAFAMGFRCPEQLRSYDRSLKQTIALAYNRGSSTEVLEGAEKAYQRLWQVLIVVTQFYEGLS